MRFISGMPVYYGWMILEWNHPITTLGMPRKPIACYEETPSNRIRHYYSSSESLNSGTEQMKSIIVGEFDGRETNMKEDLMLGCIQIWPYWVELWFDNMWANSLLSWSVNHPSIILPIWKQFLMNRIFLYLTLVWRVKPWIIYKEIKTEMNLEYLQKQGGEKRWKINNTESIDRK